MLRARQARGLQLRPGITIDDLANLLMAVTDGLAMRAPSDPTARLIDHEQKQSLLGTAALAVIHGCLERAEDTGGMTLEKAVRAKIYARKPPRTRHARKAAPRSRHLRDITAGQHPPAEGGVPSAPVSGRRGELDEREAYRGELGLEVHVAGGDVEG